MADTQADAPAQAECKDAQSNVKSTAASKTSEVKEEKKLPKLTAQEFRAYNHMAEHMNYYHNNFRQTWKTLYTACENNKRPGSISLRQFINTGLQFCHHLTLHHDIEEAHIFPVLAKKMPAFREEMEMKTAHKTIHAGLEKMEPYLDECRSGERELVLKELKIIMDEFGAVLWQHLDEEVAQLGAENMRKYWTVAEMQRMPM